MNDSNGYAVFFYPQALEALGDAIKPYLHEGDAGPHVLCNTIDTSGALIGMGLRGRNDDGTYLTLQLMVPSGMVRMVVSTHSDGSFGFGPRGAAGVVDAGTPPPAAPDASEGPKPAASPKAVAPSQA